MSRTCEECGTTLYGRSDKRFCCDSCRNSWHNKQRNNEQALMRSLNKILRRNRRILAELNPDGKQKVRMHQLAAKGFDFRYFTNTYTTRKGAIYYYCYDQGYLKIDNTEWYMLVHRKDYVE